MTQPVANPREPEAEVDAMFTDRWSPRSFVDEPLDAAQVAALFEAARWAPSCYNDQPWYFRYTVSRAGRDQFLSALVEKNRKWARHAPLLMFVLARKNFVHNGQPNRHAAFDAGAAWMSLALQARRLGLFAHGMAGFNVEKAAEVLNVSLDEFDIMAAGAVGRRGEPGLLGEELASMEKPNGRKPLVDVVKEYI